MLKAKLDQQFRDGTLSKAVRLIADGIKINDPIAWACLHEAANRIDNDSSTPSPALSEDEACDLLASIAWENGCQGALRDALREGKLINFMRVKASDAIAAIRSASTSQAGVKEMLEVLKDVTDLADRLSNDVPITGAALAKIERARAILTKGGAL